jgi:hypothetical protein
MNNGRKPLSQKGKPSGAARPLGLDEIFGNPLSVDPAIAKAIEAQGKEYRWVGYQKLVSNGGYHERGWKPVKRSECGNMESIPTFGVDPEGYIRRGDLVLAVRDKELCERHRAYLREQAGRGKQIQKKHADELRQQVKAAGIDATITEGYEDET